MSNTYIKMAFYYTHPTLAEKALRFYQARSHARIVGTAIACLLDEGDVAIPAAFKRELERARHHRNKSRDKFYLYYTGSPED